MGSLPSVHWDQASVLEPGLKSCVSDPLDVYVDDADAFFDAIAAALKDPRFQKWQIWASKSLEIEHHSAENFTLKLTWDGPRSRQLGYGDGQDRTYKAKSSINYAAKSIDYCLYDKLTEEQKRKAVEKEVELEEDSEGFSFTDSFHVHLLSDPLRVETWRVFCGHRLSGPFLASVMKIWIANAIMETKAEVKVFHDMASLDGSGLSAISEVLDGKLSYEDFWDCIQDTLENQLPKKSHGLQVTQISDTEFEMSFNSKNPGLERLDRQKDAPQFVDNHMHVKMDPQKGDLYCVGRGLGHELIFTDFMKAHRDPFRIETWTVMADGTRTAGRSIAIAWQVILHTMVSNLARQWIF